MNWATLQSHPAYGAQKRWIEIRVLLNISVFHSGGSNCASLPSFQRQPDFNQTEQQHVHPLRRDGLLANEGNSCRFANRCLKQELYQTSCDLQNYLLKRNEAKMPFKMMVKCVTLLPCFWFYASNFGMEAGGVRLMSAVFMFSPVDGFNFCCPFKCKISDVFRASLTIRN